jgi:segregation and condensation protein A
MLGDLPGWRQLGAFLPPDLAPTGIKWRSAVASTFGAALEMVRQGKARLRQDGTCGPIYLQGVRDPQ